MNIRIFQIDPECDHNRLFGEPYCFLKKQRLLPIDRSIYVKTFEGSVDAANLEEVFYMFNEDIPAGYEGRSLSVSDVVEVVNSKLCKPGFYYCDRFGFKKVVFN